jgi:flagellar basal-body rod modification protein FlgD
MTTTNPLANMRIYDPAKANQPTSTTTTDTSAAGQTQNFLKLLIAQIQNQDPMSPMDASTMTAQTANLSMVNSMQSMNTSLTALLTQMQTANFITQASSIGHSPLVGGSVIGYDGSSPVVALGANLSAPSSNLTANITNASGAVVNTIAIGAANAGMNNFTWNGKDGNGNQLPAGNYYVKLSANDAAGAALSPTSYVASPVMTVSKGSNGTDVILNLVDGRSINANDVTQWDS